MRRFIGAAAMAGLGFVGLVAGPNRASAEVVIAIDKAAQRMAVMVDGKEEYVWKVSTGTGGGPKAGSYQPQRMEKTWFSRKYNMSPMPHAIFFHEGYAIHGTMYVSQLGNRASHGCVRLHPKNAATLFDLVRKQGMAATSIVVTHSGWPEMIARPETIKPKPPADAPIKASLPVKESVPVKPGSQPSPQPSSQPSLQSVGTPKLGAAVQTTSAAATVPVSATPKPDRVLLERHTDTNPGSTGSVAVQAVEAPSLASAPSEPAAASGASDADAPK